jgi:N utilization substance protein B
VSATGGSRRAPDASARRGARRRARELAFRLAYESDLSGDPIGEVWERVREENPLTDDQRELVDDVVKTLGQRGTEVDARLSEAAEHWTLDRLSATDRAVLRAAAAELLSRPRSPRAVVLDEAIEIAKRFGSDGSGSFVNGVLDRVARSLEPGTA